MISSKPNHRRIERALVLVFVAWCIALGVAVLLRTSDLPLALLAAELLGAGSGALVACYWKRSFAWVAWVIALTFLLMAMMTIPFAARGNLDMLGLELLMGSAVLGVLIELRKERQSRRETN